MPSVGFTLGMHMKLTVSTCQIKGEDNDMTVKDLIEALSKEDPNRLVVMARDAEGNGYSPLSDWWTGAYKAETTSSGEVGLEKLDETAKLAGYGEGDVIVDGKPAIILTPTN